MRRAGILIVLTLACAAVLTACGGSSSTSSSASSSKSTVSGTIDFDGVWTGQEAKHFQAVIDAFEKQNPDVAVKYKALGDNLPTVLSTAVKPAGDRPTWRTSPSRASSSSSRRAAC